MHENAVTSITGLNQQPQTNAVFFFFFSSSTNVLGAVVILHALRQVSLPHFPFIISFYMFFFCRAELITCHRNKPAHMFSISD